MPTLAAPLRRRTHFRTRARGGALWLLPVAGRHEERSAAAGDPSARESGSTQPAHHVSVAVHQLPDERGAPVLDHRENGPLVDAEIVGVEPRHAGHDATVLET